MAVVAPLGDDYPARALHALEHRGVDLAGLRPLGRPGLRTWLLYEPAGAPHRAPAGRGEPRRGLARARRRRGAVRRRARVPPLAHAARAASGALVEELSGRAGALLSLDPHDAVREESLEALARGAGAHGRVLRQRGGAEAAGVARRPGRHAGAAGGRAAALRAAQARRGRRGALRHADARADRLVAAGHDRWWTRPARATRSRAASWRRGWPARAWPARSSAAWCRRRSRSRPGARRD